MPVIQSAFAEDTPTQTVETTAVPSQSGPAVPVEPSTTETLMMNVLMVVVMGLLFYLLLIRPQQKRYKEHSDMIAKLDRGSKVVTQGGLVGTIEKVVSDHEVVVDFGGNVKMTVMRSYILGSYDEAVKGRVANDDSKKKDKSSK